MIIDFHTHIGHSYDGSIQEIAELKKNMKKLGIDNAVVFPIDDIRYRIEEASINLKKKVKEDKNLIPFFRFDPKQITPETLKKILKDFYGVKLHSRAESFDPLSKEYFPLYKVISESGKPLLIHTKKYHVKETDPLYIVKLAELFPNLILVLAHFAYSQPKVFDYVEEKKLSNVYFDTSVVATRYQIKKVGKKIGFDKILFASDCPYSDQEVELLKIKNLDIDEKYKKNILGLNAKRILKI